MNGPAEKTAGGQGVYRTVGEAWTRRKRGISGCYGSHLIVRVSHLHVADNSMWSPQGYLMFWVSGAVLGVSIFLALLLERYLQER